jgi:hypothetical protein
LWYIKRYRSSCIEEIWRKEKSIYQQIFDEIERKESSELAGITRKQVDFKLLNAYVKAMGKLYDTPDIKNFVDFFELLAKSSTFAHKAHKELKQLNM